MGDAMSGTADADDDPERLRQALVDELRGHGVLWSPAVEAALRAVPRHLFVPAVPVRAAYANDVVPTKRDERGLAVSAASQPSIVALMLEQAEVRPGQRVLEIGAGTGYNAALLAYLVGGTGSVTTVDVDADIVEGARTALAHAGYGRVDVVPGDGALGHPAGAPYDLVIATVGAWDVPAAWLAQLTAGGRLVVPQRVRGGVSRSIAYRRDRDRWRSISSEMCGFMPLRGGIADDPRGAVPLTRDGLVTLPTHQEQRVDAEALAGVLDQPRVERRTGVLFADGESPEWLWLWLTCVLDNGLVVLSVDRSAVERGLLVAPFGGWTMATTRGGDLAYLTLLDAGPGDSGQRGYEVTVVGHGPGGDRLADEVVEQARVWDRDRRTRSVEFALQPTAAPDRITGDFVFEMPQTRLAVTWGPRS
ncbi:MAG TPA: methyltransferase, FxLD system [Micromonospora sp.]